jgi:hypothetical protein
MLIIVWRAVPAIKPFAFAAADHHYSDKAYDRACFLPLKHVPADVKVSLIAGEGGYVLFERVFRVDVEAELRLTELITDPSDF